MNNEWQNKLLVATMPNNNKNVAVYCWLKME